MKISDLVIGECNVRDASKVGDDIESLKESIKTYSLISKLILRPFNGEFEIIAGERRHQALLALYGADYELPEADYIIREDLNDDQALILSLQENQQRKEFSPFELNRAILALNSKGHKDKEIAQILNITVQRMKRLSTLGADSNIMPDIVKDQLKMLPNDAVMTDAHWQKMREVEDPDVIKEVAEFIIDKESPARDVPSIIKAIEKTHKDMEPPVQKEFDTSDAPAVVGEEAIGGPIEYSHKGELLLEGDVLKVIGKGEDKEIPVEHYLEYLRNPDKFKCYVTFKLKVKPID